MIQDIQQLKELILWAKTEKVKSFSVGDVSVELSDLALVEGLNTLEELTPENAEKSKQVIEKDLFEAQDSQKATDEDLFWSAR